MHFHAWKKGLKTGTYYLRTQAEAQAIQFTVEKEASKQVEPVIPRVSETSLNKVKHKQYNLLKLMVRVVL